MPRTLESYNGTLGGGHLKKTESFEELGLWGRKGIKYKQSFDDEEYFVTEPPISKSFIKLFSTFLVEGLPCDRHSGTESKTDEVPAPVGIVFW